MPKLSFKKSQLRIHKAFIASLRQQNSQAKQVSNIETKYNPSKKKTQFQESEVWRIYCVEIEKVNIWFILFFLLVKLWPEGKILHLHNTSPHYLKWNLRFDFEY